MVAWRRTVVPIWLTVACQGAKGSADSATTPAGGSSGSTSSTSSTTSGSFEASTEHWHGSRQLYNPYGDPDGEPQEVLLRRFLVPDNGTIGENFRAVDEDEGVIVIDRELQISGSTVSGSYADRFGSMEISGELTSGARWAWTAWELHSSYVDGSRRGGYIDASYTIGSGLGFSEAYTTVDGLSEWSSTATLTAVDAADWEAREAELLGLR